MNTFTMNMYKLGLFFASSIYYFIPCAIGSILSEFVKKKKGKKDKIAIPDAIVYSIAPTIIISSTSFYITTKLIYQDTIIGVAFICGFVSSDINSILLSIKDLLKTIVCVRKLFKNLTDSKMLDTLQKLSDELELESKNDNDENANNNK